MARFESIESVVDSLLLRSGDISRRKKGLFLDVAQDVWNDLNETTLRVAKRVLIPVRKEFQVNKRTNSIDMPCNLNRLASVNVVDECGTIHPVYRNLSLHDDIISVPPEKNCACEHNCGYKLCNTIKGYVAVQTTQSDVLPNGNPITANCISRIAVGKNGVVYKENQFLERVYTDGIWTNTIVQTESIQLCECETDDHGCLCDTEENINRVCASCGIRNFEDNIAPRNKTECVGGTAMCPPNPNCNEWTYYCDNKMDWFTVQCGCEHRGIGRDFHNIYNIGENGKRLIFPHDFGFEKALVRFYEDISLENLVIPYIAKETFMTGILWFAYEHNPEMAQMAQMYGQQYSRQKWGLFTELNRMRIAELGNTIAGKSHVPSYMDHREDRLYRYY